MIKYIGKRILFSLVSLFALITVTFFLTRMMPGNPFQLENINPSVQEQILKQYGLDRPVGEQFLLYLKNLSHGDLGMSYKKTGISVNSLIAADAPYTIRLGLIAYGVALVLGVLIGIWMAVTKKESVRGGLMFLTICGISIPNYVLALLLVLIFGVTLQWFPVVGLSTWKHYVLPVITLSVYPIAQISKLVKSSYTEAKNQDYTIIGGVDAVVDILNTVDRGTEKHIMETLEIEEPELADEIRKKMFVFEDILLLDDKAIQRVLRDVDNNDLAVALKGANEQVQNAIFNNLSKRLVVMIKEDMEFMGPVRMKDVEEAQQKIVSIIRKLEDSAEIVISRGGGDEIVV